MKKNDAVKLYQQGSGYSLRKIADNLTEANRRFGIKQYHELGPVICTNDIVLKDGINFGKFNLLLGKEWAFASGGKYKDPKNQTIHPNIYNKTYRTITIWKLGQEKAIASMEWKNVNPPKEILDEQGFAICLGGSERSYFQAINRMDYCEAFITICSMLESSACNDGTYYFSGVFNKCEICDDTIVKSQLCNKCSKLDLNEGKEVKVV